MKWVIGVVLVAVVLMVAGLLGIKPGSAPKVSVPQVLPSKAPEQIYIDVGGAVARPGVYALNSEARIGEALKAAGGLTPQADPGFVAHSLNLAQKLTDGMKIYVPVKGESGGVSGASGGPISLNSASQAQLESLPGVGAVTAQAIIAKRPYNDTADLLTKKAISKAVYDKIKDKVSAF